MPTQTEIKAISDRIRAAALMGTPTNPRGVPETLAALMVAQAKHETGNFTSGPFLRDRNAFGYTYVAGAKWQIGPGTIADNGEPVARYASIEDSTAEIVDWIYRRIKEGKFPVNLNDITTPERYAQLLKDAGYYEDTEANYLEGLRRWYVANPGVNLLLIGLIATAWALRRELRKFFTGR